MADTDSLEHGREIGAQAVVTDNVVEEVEESNEKTPAHESRRHSTVSSSQTDHDIQDDALRENQNGQNLEPATTNSEPWSAFTTPQKRFIVLMVALASFFSPLSANIYFPALNELSVDFGVSESIMNLTLTSYMIFQGLAPTLFGDLADMAGRRPAYLIGFAIYIAACIGIARIDTFAGLLILRCLQSSGSSSTIALGSGVVADIATSAERGVWMGWATSGPMVAPAIAPVLGGIFSQFLGWRWIFWFLVILSGAVMVPFALLFPETGRNVVGNGSIPPQGWNMSLLNYLQVRKLRRERASQPALQRTLSQTSTKTLQQSLRKSRKIRIPNPLHTLTLVLEKDVGLLLLFNAIIYCSFYDMMASAPTLLQQIYGFNALEIGLCFLPMGFGAFLATGVSGVLMDWNFRRTASKIGYQIIKGRANDLRTFPLERCRIQIAFPLIFIGDAAILCYGWVMHIETNLAAPLILMFITGFCMTAAFNCMSVMLVDLYPLSPATATAANNLIRCLLGAGATGVIIYMIEAMGRGWAFTFVAGVVLLFSPILWLLERRGPEWREARRVRAEELRRGREEETRTETMDSDSSQQVGDEGGEKT